MEEYLREMWSGAGRLRFFLQPAVALMIGLLGGLSDARMGRPPYLLDLVRERGHRAEKLRLLLKRLAVPLSIAIAMSVVFQLVNRGTVSWLAALGFGVFFILLPYVVARGTSNRVATRISRRHQA
jgi:hypothetical protein